MSTVKQKVSHKRLILLGPPGAGKGTQAKLLAEHLGVPHIASGDLFRSHQHKGTPLGLKVTEYVRHGLLVPDEITVAMVLEEVIPLVGLVKNGFLLDGFPRNLAQAKALEEALASRGALIDLAVLIKVPQEELVTRLSGRLVCRSCQALYHRQTAPPKVADQCDQCGGELYQRPDDRPEAVKTRIQVYEEETAPTVEHYRRSGSLVEVDGTGTVSDVERRLHQSLKD